MASARLLLPLRTLDERDCLPQLLGCYLDRSSLERWARQHTALLIDFERVECSSR